MAVRAFEISANTPVDVDTSAWKAWDFVGVGKWNKGKSYRSYASSHADAVAGVVTEHRLHPRDIEPLRHDATDCEHAEIYCRKCAEWVPASHRH